MRHVPVIEAMIFAFDGNTLGTVDVLPFPPSARVVSIFLVAEVTVARWCHEYGRLRRRECIGASLKWLRKT
jgi:hypothetical protein